MLKTFICITLIFFLTLGSALPSFAKDLNVKNDTQSFLFVSGTSSNVGINSSAPQAKLDVEGNVYVGNGNIGIGVVPSYPLHVNGQCVTGDTRLRRRRRKNVKSNDPASGDGNAAADSAGCINHLQYDDYIYDEIRIDQIQPGDEIQSLDEKTGRLVWSRVNGLMDMGVKDIYKLTTASGKTIRTTGNHPYFVRNEYPISTNFMHDSVFIILSRLARDFYHRVLVKMSVRVPCLNSETVAFSHQGWDHLLDKERSRLNLLSRYMALPKIIPLLSDPLARMTYEKRGDYEFWAIHGAVDGVKVKVIIRSIKGGGKHFYSVLWMGEDERPKKKRTANENLSAVRSSNNEAVSCLYPQCQGVGTLQLQLEYRRFVAQMSRVISRLTEALINARYKRKSRQVVAGSGTWKKVADLYESDFIAVAASQRAERGCGEWDKVIKIETLPPEQVWDIEVEGTHNFVGNDIIAHNTYLNGNVGINTATPFAKLQVDGSIYIPGLLGNIGVGTVLPAVGLQLGTGASTHTGQIASQNDLLVKGDVEIDGAVYIDSALYVGSGMPNNVGMDGEAGEAYFAEDVEIDGALYVDGFIYGNGSQLTGVSSITNLTDNYIPRANGSTAIENSIIYDDNINIGIGSIAPQAKLDVEGNVYVGNGGYIGVGTVPSYPLHVNGQCVTGDTRLKRRRRRQRKDPEGKWIEEDYFEDVRIDQIRPGDEIMTLDERSGCMTVSRVNALMDMGIKDIFVLTTSTGKQIRTTGNHPYLTLPSGYFDPSRVAVFLDAANFEVSVRSMGLIADYGDLGASIGGIIAARNYYSVNFNDAGQGRLFTFLKHHGWRLVTKALKAIRRRGTDIAHKANFDVEIAYDACDRKDAYDVAVLFSGDSDFVYMSEKLQKAGKHVVVVSPSGRTAKELKVQASVFVELDQMSFLKADAKDNKKGPQGAYKNDLATAVKILTQVAPFVKGAGAWMTATNILVGQMVAVVGDNGKPVFERVESIDHTPAEQVYDIEVEGTHNFVGNDIIAHNTYLNGNVGINTATPFAKLQVDGSIYIPGLLGNIGVGTVLPAVGLQLGTGASTHTGQIASQNDLLVKGDVEIDGAVYIDSALYVGSGMPNNVGMDGEAGEAYFAKDVEVDGALYVDGFIYGNGSQLTGVNSITNLTDNYIPRANGSTAIENSIIYDDNTNIGIGSIAPQAKLDVEGNVYVGNGGYIGVGTVPSYPLHVNGQCVTGDTRLRRRRRKNTKSNDPACGDGNIAADPSVCVDHSRYDDYIYDEIRIDQIQPGDEIQSLEEKTGRLVWSRVNGLMDMGVKDIYKLTTESGKTIRTTGNHPYLVHRKIWFDKSLWAKLFGFSLQQEAPLRWTFIDEIGSGRDPNQPYFGVGSLTLTGDEERILEMNQKLRMVFMSAVNELRLQEDRFEFKFKNVTWRSLPFYKKLLGIIEEYADTVDFSCIFDRPSRHLWEQYVNMLGMLLNTGHKHIVIADFINKPKSSKVSLAALTKMRSVEKILQIEAQGSIFVQLADILVGTVNFSMLHDEEKSNQKSELSKLALEVIQKVLDKKKRADTDYVCAAHNETIIEYTKNVKSGSVGRVFTPQLHLEYNAFSSKEDRIWKKVIDIKEGDLIAVAASQRAERGCGGVPGRISPAVAASQRAERGCGEWDKVIKIETLPPEQVWDIEVEGTHNFVGNDIIAHNTYLNGNVGINSANPTTRLAIDGAVYVNGNVGIGTSIPRASLEVGSTAVFSTLVANTCNGATTINWNVGNKQLLTLNGNCTALTFTAPAGGVGNFTLKIINAGNYSIAWPTILWPGGSAPTLTADGTDFVTFFYDGSSYYGSASFDFQ